MLIGQVMLSIWVGDYIV